MLVARPRGSGLRLDEAERRRWRESEKSVLPKAVVAVAVELVGWAELEPVVMAGRASQTASTDPPPLAGGSVLVGKLTDLANARCVCSCERNQ